MRTDQDIKNDILDELEWDPEVDMADIGVTVVDGAVSLTGTVSSYTQRRAAERAVRRVRGVVAIAQDIRVELANEFVQDDSGLAKRLAHVLEWDPALPHKDIRAEVRNGHVTLSGTVPWHFQREVVEDHIARLRGVRSIDNGIRVLHSPSSRDVRKEIIRALHRNADLEASQIAVDVKDGVVHLGGTVRAYYEKDIVKNAVLMAPGVVAVRDELRIS